MSHDEQAARPDAPHQFQIQIDRTHFTVTSPQLTGAQLRQLPKPPIGPDRDLFEIVPGGSDKNIGDSDVVEMRNWLRFFAAPAQINPGNDTEPQECPWCGKIVPKVLSERRHQCVCRPGVIIDRDEAAALVIEARALAGKRGDSPVEATTDTALVLGAASRAVEAGTSIASGEASI